MCSSDLSRKLWHLMRIFSLCQSILLRIMSEEMLWALCSFVFMFGRNFLNFAGDSMEKMKMVKERQSMYDFVIYISDHIILAMP